LQNWTPPTPRKNIPNTGTEGFSYLKKINKPDTKVCPNNKNTLSKVISTIFSHNTHHMQ
jgi:hypothetical protein